MSVSFAVPVTSVSLDAGYFDNVGSTRVLFLNSQGGVIAQQFNRGFGIESFFAASQEGIAEISVVAVSTEESGFAIDNLSFEGGTTLVAPVSSTPNPSDTIDLNLGNIENRTGILLLDSLGPGDRADQFSFTTENSVVITYRLSLADGVGGANTYTLEVGPGSHLLRVADPMGYASTENYNLLIQSVVSTDMNEREIDLTAANLAQDITKFVAIDLPELAVKLAQVIRTADDARLFYKKLDDYLGPAGYILDVFFRIDDVVVSSNPARETFAQTVDFAAGVAATTGGAAGGAYVGGLFAGVGAGIGAPVGGFASGLVYTLAVSDSVLEGARATYDAVIPAPPSPLSAVLEFDRHDGDQPPQPAPGDVVATPFDVDWYLSTYSDARDAVANGDVPSAYIHYLLVGVQRGYAPNGVDGPLSAADVIGAGQSDLAEYDLRPDLFETDFGQARGDGINPEEAAFLQALAQVRTTGLALGFDAELMAIANRKALDLSHNMGAAPLVLQAQDPEDWAALWSTGETFAALLGPSAAGLSFWALAAGPISGEEALEQFFSDIDIRAELLAAENRSLGLAEYGGVWVLILDDRPPVSAPEAESVTTGLQRFGSERDDILSLGNWGGTLLGGEGFDWLFGGSRADLLDGGVGADRMEGGLGNDFYIVDDVGDRVQGEVAFSAGGGIDTVRTFIDNYVQPDNIELVRIGNITDTDNHSATGNDAPGTLVGNAGNNTLTGRGGNDQLNGNNGDDVIIGNTGRDTVVGGAGSDTFVYTAYADSRAGSLNRDVINGFDRLAGADDVIDLSAMDANTTTFGVDDAFVFIGARAFTGTAGELRYQGLGGPNAVIVEADHNGDGAADFQIFVNLTTYMTGSDFIL